MKQKRFLIMSLVLGGVFVVSTALASMASTFSVDQLVANKKMTVGTKSNKGKLLVLGYLKNSNKAKPVTVKDHLKVTGNVNVGGVLQGNNIVSNDNLGTGVVTENKIDDGAVASTKIADSAISSGKIASDAVTSAKIADDAVGADQIDMTMNGVVKAGAYVLDGGTVLRQFNNLSSATISATNVSTGTFAVDFGSDVSERYVQVTPLRADTTLHTVISSISNDTVNMSFYTTDEEGQLVDPTGFFIMVY